MNPENCYNNLKDQFCNPTIEMDFDGIMLLIDQDYERFQEWRSESKNFSRIELGKSSYEWFRHYQEAYAKYKDVRTGDAMKDAPLMCAEQIYFHDLCNYTLQSLVLYTEKLRKEFDELSKSTKSRNRSSKIMTKKKRERILNKTFQIS